MIAFTFPGQGSQRPGAGAAWLDHPAWRIVEAATAATGRDVARLLLDADAEELRATDNAQLSTYVASLLVLDAVRRGGLEASHLAGHSLGEYTALTAAGVLTIEDGARLVAERGAAMLDASRSQPGTMAAVLGADDDAVEAACAEVRAGGLDAWVANYNAPGPGGGGGLGRGPRGGRGGRQGPRREADHAGRGVRRLPHARTWRPRRSDSTGRIAAASFGDAALPTVANVDGALHHSGAEWSALASRQLCSPVRWAQGLRTLQDAGVTTFIEIGPGTVLTGMAKRTVTGATTASAATPDEVEQVVASVTARTRVERVGERPGQAPAGPFARLANLLARRPGRGRAANAVRACARVAGRSRCDGVDRCCCGVDERRTHGCSDHRGRRRAARQDRHQRGPRSPHGHDRRLDRRAHRHPRAPHRRHDRRARRRGRAATPWPPPASGPRTSTC